MTNTILIVEDEPKLATLLSDYLKQSGFQTHIIDNGLTVLDWVRHHSPALVILDLMLPGKDGINVCKELRLESDIPIIMATAKVEEIDRLLGLELGADDYVCKPFSYREIVARVNAILRRLTLRNKDQNDTKIQASDTKALHLNESKYQATLNGIRLELTAVEFKLLATLAKDPGRIYNREQLMTHIYEEYRVVSDRTIDSHIKKLRQKLRVVTGDEEHIHSVYSVGYKYEAPFK